MYRHDIEFVQKQIQKTPIANFDMNKNQRVDKYRDAIEPVTRKYEEEFMCEPQEINEHAAWKKRVRRCIPQSPEKVYTEKFRFPRS